MREKRLFVILQLLAYCKLESTNSECSHNSGSSPVCQESSKILAESKTESLSFLKNSSKAGNRSEIIYQDIIKKVRRRKRKGVLNKAINWCSSGENLDLKICQEILSFGKNVFDLEKEGDRYFNDQLNSCKKKGVCVESLLKLVDYL